VFTEVERRMRQNCVSKNTEIGRANNLARLKRHWQGATRSSFDTFLVRNVDAGVMSKDHSLAAAKKVDFSVEGALISPQPMPPAPNGEIVSLSEQADQSRSA
jgi:hypothetical protein